VLTPRRQRVEGPLSGLGCGAPSVMTALTAVRAVWRFASSRTTADSSSSLFAMSALLAWRPGRRLALWEPGGPERTQTWSARPPAEHPLGINLQRNQLHQSHHGDRQHGPLEPGQGGPCCRIRRGWSRMDQRGCWSKHEDSLWRLSPTDPPPPSLADRRGPFLSGPHEHADPACLEGLTELAGIRENRGTGSPRFRMSRFLL
jgi:hypothetical protein